MFRRHEAQPVPYRDELRFTRMIWLGMVPVAVLVGTGVSLVVGARGVNLLPLPLIGVLGLLILVAPRRLTASLSETQAQELLSRVEAISYAGLKEGEWKDYHVGIAAVGGALIVCTVILAVVKLGLLVWIPVAVAYTLARQTYDLERMLEAAESREGATYYWVRWRGQGRGRARRLVRTDR